MQAIHWLFRHSFRYAVFCSWFLVIVLVLGYLFFWCWWDMLVVVMTSNSDISVSLTYYLIDWYPISSQCLAFACQDHIWYYRSQSEMRLADHSMDMAIGYSTTGRPYSGYNERSVPPPEIPPRSPIRHPISANAAPVPEPIHPPDNGAVPGTVILLQRCCSVGQWSNSCWIVHCSVVIRHSWKLSTSCWMISPTWKQVYLIVVKSTAARMPLHNKVGESHAWFSI